MGPLVVAIMEKADRHKFHANIYFHTQANYL